MRIKHFVVFKATGTILSEIPNHQVDSANMLFKQIPDNPFTITKVVEHPADPNFKKVDNFYNNLDNFKKENNYGN